MATIAGITSPIITRFFPGKVQRLTPGAVRVLRQMRRADTTKSRTELGFRPTPIRDAIQAAYDDFVRRGLITPRRAVAQLTAATGA
jgi:nucleoside-diphosphate-sugar epimerase